MEHIKSLIKEKKYILLIIAALVLAEIFFFSKYGYHWLKAVRYMILTVFMVFLGFIDQQKTIIPNKLLLFMFVIRAVILAGEITVKNPAMYIPVVPITPPSAFPQNFAISLIPATSNQNTEFSAWCRPNGISSRLKKP